MNPLLFSALMAVNPSTDSIPNCNCQLSRIKFRDDGQSHNVWYDFDVDEPFRLIKFGDIYIREYMILGEANCH